MNPADRMVVPLVVRNKDRFSMFTAEPQILPSFTLIQAA
jgi:hypothetical protein